MPSNLEDVELAYLAGFFDADGSVGIYGHNGTDNRPRKTTRRFGKGLRARAGWTETSGADQFFSLRMNVSGLDEISIRRFHNRWGGTFGRTDRDGERRIWYWFASGTRAKVALSDMLPFLKVKKPQAFEALKTPISTPGKNLSPEDGALRIELSERIKRLKKEVA